MIQDKEIISSFQQGITKFTKTVEADLVHTLQNHSSQEWQNLAQHVKVSHNGDKLHVSFGHLTNKAQELEYGSLEQDPTPAIRPMLAKYETQHKNLLGELLIQQVGL